MKNFRMTPAAAKAASVGDVDNMLVAMTPGGIEAQEAAGQALLCASEQLPKEINGASREQLVALGFTFGHDVDELFVKATLPPGWKKVATDHSMHSNILDDQGRERASIFYKAAFYDRRASMSMTSRFHVSGYEEDPTDKDRRLVQVKDCGKPVFNAGAYDAGDWKACKPLEDIAREWLEGRYPDYRSPLAHWDAP